MAAPTLTQEMTLLLSNSKADTYSGISVGGKLYQAKLSLGSGETSKAILIPQGQLSDIRIDADKAPASFYGTLSSEADILAGTAIWTAITVSGITSIPLACNAVYVVGNASASVVLINARMIGG